MATSPQPSHYQQAIIDATTQAVRALKCGQPYQNIVVEATAGAGKTSTILLCVQGLATSCPGSRSVVVAFNKRVADEMAARLPSTAKAMTLHSLGRAAWVRTVGRQVEVDGNKIGRIVQAEIDANRMPRWLRGKVAKLVDLARMHGIVPGATIASTHDDCVQSTASHSQASPPTATPASTHATALGPLQPLLDDVDAEWERLMLRFDVSFDDTATSKQIIRHARDVLTTSNRYGHRIIDFVDMLYLPTLCAATRWDIDADVVFVDELQDLDVLQGKMLMHITSNRVFVGVGDTHQCQPPDTQVSLAGGGTRRIADLRVGDRVVTYNRREAAFVGRTVVGNQRNTVLAVAARDYTGDLVTVGVGSNTTECTLEHRWVTRWATHSDDLHCVYLMRRGSRFRVGWCKLFIRNQGLHLGQRARIEGADSAWVLKIFTNRTEASIYESVVACRFGLPTITFEPVSGANHLTAEAIDSFFIAVQDTDLTSKAVNCLTAHGRLLSAPLWKSEADEGGARQGRTTIFETAAANLLDGLMMLPVYHGQKDIEWEVARIGRKPYSGVVYSIKVDGPETYIANGIATHNSIYNWRGADADAMQRIATTTRAKTLPLSICYRCPSGHIQAARKWSPRIEAAPGACPGVFERYDAEGKLACNSVAAHGDDCECRLGANKRLQPTDFQPGDVVICRAKAPLVKMAFWLMRARRPCRILGRNLASPLLSFIDSMRCTDVPSLLRKVNMVTQRLILRALDLDDETVAEEARDRQAVIVAVADGYDGDDVAELRAELEALFGDGEDRGSVVTLSTVHKFKGGEADRVWWLDHHKPDPESRGYKHDWQRTEAGHIRFVAMTRARRELRFFRSEGLTAAG